VTCLSRPLRRSPAVVRVMLAILADPLPTGGVNSEFGEGQICTAHVESCGASVRVTRGKIPSWIYMILVPEHMNPSYI
jgi:hypothetical protein